MKHRGLAPPVLCAKPIAVRLVALPDIPPGTETTMPYYMAPIHKDVDSGYGVSFPDVPGVTTAADTFDEAIGKATEVLEFASEDWSDRTGREFPRARTI